MDHAKRVIVYLFGIGFRFQSTQVYTTPPSMELSFRKQVFRVVEDEQESVSLLRFYVPVE